MSTYFVKKSVQEAFNGKQTPKGFVDADMSRTISIAIILILSASALLTIQPTPTASAASLPEPLAPQFSLKYADYSYYQKPTYTMSPYTGENVLSKEGYYAVNKSVIVTINNPAFTPYKDKNGNILKLYYEIQWKGHFEQDWRSLYQPYYIIASNSQFTTVAMDTLENPGAPATTVVLGLGVNNGTNTGAYAFLRDAPAEGQLDFQVKTYLGYYARAVSTDMYGRTHDYEVFTGESSDWSNTQTIDLSVYASNQPAASPPTAAPTETPTTAPTTTSDQPDTQTTTLPQLSWEQTAILVLVGVVGALSVGIVMLWRKVTRISAANMAPKPPPPT